MATSSRSPRAHVFITRTTGRAASGAISHAQARLDFHGETEVGSTANVEVYSDGGAQSNQAANTVLNSADADFGAVQAWFGGIALPQGQDGDDQNIPRTAIPIRVLTDPNAGGAYHFGCDATDLYIEPDPPTASGLMVAELVEVFQAAINNGWDCGHTNGEGLSRVLAGERNANLLPMLAQPVQGWSANGQQDYVNDNSADDQNQDANGCGTLFLYYLNGNLGFSWQQIVSAGGATLYECYQNLAQAAGQTVQSPQDCFSAFVAQVNQLGDAGLANLPPTWPNQGGS